MLLLIEYTSAEVTKIILFQYIHVTINQSMRDLRMNILLFQYIHVTINHIAEYIHYNTTVSFNTSMLLLIGFAEEVEYTDMDVSIHPCYY